MEAIVAVDTDGISQAGERKPMSKMLPIPHLPAVMGFRGQGMFAANVLQWCTCGGFASFDELVAALPGILAGVDLSLPEHLKVSVQGGGVGNEVIAVGWSHAQGRMLGHVFSEGEDLPGFFGRERGAYIAPWDEDSMAGIPKTAKAVERIARAQVRWMQAKIGLGGGKLIVCRVTKGSLTMNHVALLESGGTVCR